MKRSVAITPTITTDDVHVLRDQMNKIEAFAQGVHIDYADGDFAPSQLIPVDQTWRSDTLITHAHMMLTDPLAIIDDILALDADLVVLHAESKNVKESLQRLADNGTRTGIAVLADTTVADVRALDADELFEHILVFGGHLGYQGGTANLAALDLVRDIKQAYPDVEIGWDGGVDDTNAAQIADAGVTVLNVGGYIKNAEDPKKAYDKLASLVS